MDKHTSNIHLTKGYDGYRFGTKLLKRGFTFYGSNRLSATAKKIKKTGLTKRLQSVFRGPIGLISRRRVGKSCHSANLFISTTAGDTKSGEGH